jgi:hypothetical protein
VDALRTLKVPFKIWIIEKYIDDNNKIIYSIPDFNEAMGGSIETTMDTPDSQTRQGSLMTRVVHAGILNDGDLVYMDYGPKGKPKTHFKGTIRENGIELDGKIYSPSIAALKCIQTVSNSRNSANGWVVWKTADGLLINEAYTKLIEMEGK